ncbi:50S ribosomal protein L6 [Thermopetrobacter sp. TC1]|uniref:50S ribosomal protein L6 n=1 Tax=Thermopetrobacter sp. TC1 TaxID=1495045 RepID=UPI00056FDEAD|nr:50S ribosomal protein L6 [Thermopetrobacter sp. TC1]
MSRIGKKPVPIPSGVTVTVEEGAVTVKGPKGQLEAPYVKNLVSVEVDGDQVVVKPLDMSKPARSAWGMTRTIIANMVKGVTEGFQKKLQIVGVGYRAQLQGRDLKLNLGYSHDVIYKVPDGIEVQVPQPTEIIVSGIDKQKVGQVAAEIRAWRPPEPYKGKGIRYADEYIFRKEGKKK